MFSGVIERLHYFIIYDLLLLVCGDVEEISKIYIWRYHTGRVETSSINVCHNNS